MIRLLLSALVLATSLLTVNIGHAVPLEGLDELKGSQAAAAMDLLEYLPWIAEGEDTGQHVYILYSPYCGYCTQLYDETRNWLGSGKPQLRWIMLDAEFEYNGVFDSMTPETLRKIVKEKFVPENKNPEQNKQIAEYTQVAVGLMIGAEVFPAGVPAVIIGTREDVGILAGYSPDWKDVFAAAPKGTAKGSAASGILYNKDKKVVEIPVKKETTYTNQTGADVLLVPAPFADAPRIGRLEPGASLPLPLRGVTEDGYVIFAQTPQLHTIIVRDPAFVKQVLKK